MLLRDVHTCRLSRSAGQRADGANECRSGLRVLGVLEPFEGGVDTLTHALQAA